MRAWRAIRGRTCCPRGCSHCWGRRAMPRCSTIPKRKCRHLYLASSMALLWPYVRLSLRGQGGENTPSPCSAAVTGIAPQALRSTRIKSQDTSTPHLLTCTRPASEKNRSGGPPTPPTKR